MQASASALAQTLAQHEDDDILQALGLVISQRPELVVRMADLLQEGAPKRYTGVISCFFDEKHFGFITSEEITAEFGQDAFPSSMELGQFGVGSFVSFSIALNKDNKPQARLLLEGSGSEGPNQPSKKRAWSGGIVLPPQKTARPNPVASPAASYSTSLKGWVKIPASTQPAAPAWDVNANASWGASDGRYVGTITAFYPERRYGFIKSDEISQQFGTDAFLSDQEVGVFGVDSVVSFRVAVNAKGQPQARELQDASQQDASQQDASQQWGQQHDPSGMRYTGTIHNFIPDRHYGFISSSEVTVKFGVDTFLSDKEISIFNNGDTVSFEIALSKQGKPQARNLQPAEASESVS